MIICSEANINLIMLNPTSWLELVIGLAIDSLPLVVGKRSQHPAKMNRIEILRLGPRPRNVVNLKDTVRSNPSFGCWMKIDGIHSDYSISAPATHYSLYCYQSLPPL